MKLSAIAAAVGATLAGEDMEIARLSSFAGSDGASLVYAQDADSVIAAGKSGAGAVIALASDLRIGSERAKFAFLFVRVGLAGADMGAAFLLPRVIGLAAFQANLVSP